MMKCKGVYKYICENLDVDEDSARCREIKKHLDACPDCTAYLDSLKKTITLYRAEKGPKLPASAHKRLFSKLDVTPSSTRRTRKGHPSR